MVGALAAVGVQDEFLPRAMRQHPLVFGGAFTAVISGLLLQFFKVGSYFGLFLLIVGVLGSLWMGIFAIRDRETPAVSLKIAPLADSETGAQLTVEASGTSLSPAESAMLRVVGIRHGADEKTVRHICEHSQSGILGEENEVDVLSWGTSGPDLTGGVSLSSSLVVTPLQHRFVCARVALLDRNQITQATANSSGSVDPGQNQSEWWIVNKLLEFLNKSNQYRSAWVIVDLEAQQNGLALLPERTPPNSSSNAGSPSSQETVE